MAAILEERTRSSARGPSSLTDQNSSVLPDEMADDEWDDTAREPWYRFLDYFDVSLVVVGALLVALQAFRGLGVFVVVIPGAWLPVLLFALLVALVAAVVFVAVFYTLKLAFTSTTSAGESTMRKWWHRISEVVIVLLVGIVLPML
jgi:hypothetical protein